MMRFFFLILVIVAATTSALAGNRNDTHLKCDSRTSGTDSVTVEVYYEPTPDITAYVKFRDFSDEPMRTIYIGKVGATSTAPEQILYSNSDGFALESLACGRGHFKLPTTAHVLDYEMDCQWVRQ